MLVNRPYRTSYQVIRIVVLLFLLSMASVGYAIDKITSDGLTYSVMHGNRLMLSIDSYGGTELIVPDTVWYEGEAFPVVQISVSESIESNNLERIRLPQTVEEVKRLSESYVSHNIFWKCSSLKNIEVAEENKWLCSEDGVLFSKDKTELFAVPAAKEGIYMMPETVTEIHNEAFSGCKFLAEVYVSKNATSLGCSVFRNCLGLKRIVIPQGLLSIGDRAFEGTSIESIVLPEGIEEIGHSWFADCKMKSMIVPEGVKTIGQSAFSDCYNLESITLPNTITTIGENAFSGCTQLSSITIGDNVTSIGSLAFFACYHLTSVTIPKNVTYIGYDVFRYCVNLKSVIIESMDIDAYKELFDVLLYQGIGMIDVYVHKDIIEKAKSMYSGTILSIEDYETGISHVPTAVRDSEERLYDLQGRRLKAVPQRGMYIHNGRKYVVK